jgi:hypothetical protein
MFTQDWDRRIEKSNTVEMFRQYLDLGVRTSGWRHGAHATHSKDRRTFDTSGPVDHTRQSIPPCSLEHTAGKTKRSTLRYQILEKVTPSLSREGDGITVGREVSEVSRYLVSGGIRRLQFRLFERRPAESVPSHLGENLRREFLSSHGFASARIR